MKKIALPVVLAAAALGLAPPQAQAQFWGPAPTPPAAFVVSTVVNQNVCASGFSICINFLLESTATNTYQLTATFTNGDGVLTDFGIFGSPFAGLVAGSASTGYTTSTACTSLSPANVAVCADANPPPVGNGITQGGTASFTFTTTTALSSANFSSSGGYGFAGHIQSYGSTNCSLKVGSEYVYTNGVIAAGTDCVPTTTVPEPVSAILLATGLIGTGLLRRRRRGNDVTNG